MQQRGRKRGSGLATVSRRVLQSKFQKGEAPRTTYFRHKCMQGRLRSAQQLRSRLCLLYRCKVGSINRFLPEHTHTCNYAQLPRRGRPYLDVQCAAVRPLAHEEALRRPACEEALRAGIAGSSVCRDTPALPSGKHTDTQHANTHTHRDRQTHKHTHH